MYSRKEVFTLGPPRGSQKGVRGYTDRFREKYSKTIQINTTTKTTISKYNQIISKKKE